LAFPYFSIFFRHNLCDLFPWDKKVIMVESVVFTIISVYKISKMKQSRKIIKGF